MAPSPKILVQPREPFCIEWDGYTQTFNPGRIFEHDHPVVLAYPSLFVPVEPMEFDRKDYKPVSAADRDELPAE